MLKTIDLTEHCRDVSLVLSLYSGKFPTCVEALKYAGQEEGEIEILTNEYRNDVISAYIVGVINMDLAIELMKTSYDKMDSLQSTSKMEDHINRTVALTLMTGRK